MAGLGELKVFADFVLIGGWEVYLWTRKLKSRDIDVYIDALKQMLREYDAQHNLRDTIKRVISESRIEYRLLGLSYEKDGVQLKKIYENL